MITVDGVKTSGQGLVEGFFRHTRFPRLPFSVQEAGLSLVESMPKENSELPVIRELMHSNNPLRSGH